MFRHVSQLAYHHLGKARRSVNYLQEDAALLLCTEISSSLHNLSDARYLHDLRRHERAKLDQLHEYIPDIFLVSIEVQSVFVSAQFLMRMDDSFRSSSRVPFSCSACLSSFLESLYLGFFFSVLSKRDDVVVPRRLSQQ